MAIAIPSDLILDVMRNAPPPRTGAARAEAAAAEAGAAKPSTLFTGILKHLSPVARPEDDLIMGVLSAGGGSKAALATSRLAGGSSESGFVSFVPASSARNSPQAAFEQMVLRNMFESMLPAADSGIYGEEGSSSGVWRSLAADQLATTYANAGGLGIASALMKADANDGIVGRPQWPYFEQSAISSFTG